MAGSSERHFQGFSRKAFTFLRDLGQNNDKAWFDKQDVFTLEGETYKRPIGQDKPEPIRTWYQYKGFYLSANRTIDDAILSAEFADQLTDHFALAAPLYHYIRRIASQVLATGR